MWRRGKAAAARETQIERLATVVTAEETPQDWPSVRPRLRPVIRRADFNLAQPGGPELAGLSRPYAPCLSEFVVIDQPDRMGYVSVKQASEWGVGGDEVFAAARENLAEEFRGLLERRESTEPSATAFMGMGHSYFGSLPLVDGWIAAWSADWGGRRPVFVTAQQNELLIAPEPEDPEALLDMLANAEQEWTDAARPVSPVIYSLDEAGRVVAYDVPADSPARAAIRRSRGLLAATVYDGQTGYLRAEAGPGDPFAAALQRFSRPDDGSSFTLATWGDGEAALLPEADWVAFAGAGDQFFVRWEDVMDACGLVAEPGCHPTRYRVDGWPGAEVVTRLRGLAGRP